MPEPLTDCIISPMKKIVNVCKQKVLLVWLLLSLPAWAPWAYPGAPKTWVGLLPLYHLQDFLLKVRDFLAWVPPGSHYQLWQSDGWLAYGVPAVLVRLGVPGWDALKITYVLAMLLGSLGMLLWSERLLGRERSLWALVPALGYLYSPYVLTAAFTRGAGAELLALGLAPWLGLALSAGWIVAAVVLAALGLWAQPGIGLMSLALAAAGLPAWRLFSGTGWRRRDSALLASPLVGGLVGAAGLLPRYLAHGAGSGLDPSASVVYLHQLFMPRWGFGFNVPGWKDTMPLQLGAPLVLLAVGGVLLAREYDRRKATFLLTAAGVLSLLSLNFLRPLWHLLGPRSPLAYPWQLLGFATMALALAGGWIGKGVTEKGMLKEAVAVGALALVLVVGYAHLDPELVYIASPEHPVGVFGKDNVALVDAAVWTEPKQEHVFFVRLSWQNIHTLDEDYSIFIHIVDSSGKRIAQHDELLKDEYGNGTSKWWPGELVKKEYELRLKLYGTRPYKAHVGLYQWKSGKRLPVGKGTDVTIEVVDER